MGTLEDRFAVNAGPTLVEYLFRARERELTCEDLRLDIDEVGHNFHVNLTNEPDPTELHLPMFPFLLLFGGCSLYCVCRRNGNFTAKLQTKLPLGQNSALVYLPGRNEKSLLLCVPIHFTKIR